MSPPTPPSPRRPPVPGPALSPANPDPTPPAAPPSDCSDSSEQKNVYITSTEYATILELDARVLRVGPLALARGALPDLARLAKVLTSGVDKLLPFAAAVASKAPPTVQEPSASASSSVSHSDRTNESEDKSSSESSGITESDRQVDLAHPPPLVFLARSQVGFFNSRACLLSTHVGPAIPGPVREILRYVVPREAMCPWDALASSNTVKHHLAMDQLITVQSVAVGVDALAIERALNPASPRPFHALRQDAWDRRMVVSITNLVERDWFHYIYIVPCAELAKGCLEMATAMRLGLGVVNMLRERVRLNDPAAATKFQADHKPTPANGHSQANGRVNAHTATGTTAINPPRGTLADPGSLDTLYGIVMTGPLWVFKSMHIVDTPTGTSYPTTTLWEGAVDRPESLLAALSILEHIAGTARRRAEAIACLLRVLDMNGEKIDGAAGAAEAPPIPMRSRARPRVPTVNRTAERTDTDTLQVPGSRAAGPDFQLSPGPSTIPSHSLSPSPAPSPSPLRSRSPAPVATYLAAPAYAPGKSPSPNTQARELETSLAAEHALELDLARALEEKRLRKARERERERELERELEHQLERERERERQLERDLERERERALDRALDRDRERQRQRQVQRQLQLDRQRQMEAQDREREELRRRFGGLGLVCESCHGGLEKALPQSATPRPPLQASQSNLPVHAQCHSHPQLHPQHQPHRQASAPVQTETQSRSMDTLGVPVPPRTYTYVPGVGGGYESRPSPGTEYEDADPLGGYESRPSPVVAGAPDINREGEREGVEGVRGGERDGESSSSTPEEDAEPESASSEGREVVSRSYAEFRFQKTPQLDAYALQQEVQAEQARARVAAWCASI